MVLVTALVLLVPDVRNLTRRPHVPVGKEPGAVPPQVRSADAEGAVRGTGDGTAPRPRPVPRPR